MLFELNYFPREIVIETISLGIIVMISHQNYLSKISNWICMCKIVILYRKYILRYNNVSYWMVVLIFEGCIILL